MKRHDRLDHYAVLKIDSENVVKRPTRFVTFRTQAGNQVIALWNVEARVTGGS